jgi:hypothetical protein
MERPNDNPAPNRLPPKITNQEIERILHEAESLAGEIVDTVDLKRPLDQAGTSAAGQFGAIEPDPLAALELVEQDLAQVQDALPPAPFAPEQGTKGDTASPGTIELKPPDLPPPPIPDRVVDGGRHQAIQVIAPPTDAGPRKSPPISSPRAASAAEEHIQHSSSSPDAESTTGSGLPKAARPFAYRTIRHVAVSLPNALMGIVILLDRPFASLSSYAKRIAGIVGLISLAMGLVAMFAPRMLAHNPYAQMEPRPKTAEISVEQGDSEPAQPVKRGSADHGPAKTPAGGH